MTTSKEHFNKAINFLPKGLIKVASGELNIDGTFLDAMMFDFVGDLDSGTNTISAGELGAIQIYKGQLAVLKNKPIAKEIISMLKQEEKHYKTFSDLLIKHNIRPTLLSPLWKVGGFSLGVFTAILGKESTMACTEAVEEVIVKHYQQQTKYLKKNKNELYKITSNFAKEEKSVSINGQILFSK